MHSYDGGGGGGGGGVCLCVCVCVGHRRNAVRGHVSCRYDISGNRKWLGTPPTHAKGQIWENQCFEYWKHLSRVLVFSRPVIMEGLRLLASERRVVW